jgi:RimJ/RimL family protein N-acetyltransferase
MSADALDPLALLSPDPAPARVVRLRPVQPADLDRFFGHQVDPEANAMAAFTPADPFDRTAFDARWRRILGDPEVTVRTIVVEGTVAGSIMRWRDPALDGPEVSYWLGREWWGLGIATAALVAFLDEIADRPLYGRTASTNPASRHVLERAGFRLVRLDRGVEATDGRLVDELVLRLD